MLDAAAKFSEKGVKMFASWQDIMNMQFSNREQPWVVDDKLIIDDSDARIHGYGKDHFR